jgi:outer membrane protein assembly factor BamD (BamD/ComL family)
MIEGYRQLGMHELADDAQQVLESNFPDERVAANP